MDVNSTGLRRLPAPAAILLAAFVAAGCATGGDTSAEDVPRRDGDGDGRSDVDVGGDAATCPDACPAGQHCVDGHCVSSSCGADGCPGGESCCDGFCTNTRNDPANCGECGTVCSPHGDSCLAATCSCNGAAACSIERSCCPGLGCIDTMADPTHCGGCDTVCDATVECLAGACGGSCVTGCPDVPHGTTACAGESCAISSCEDGWADVDGVVGNGCECPVTAEPEGGETCDTAIDLGTITEGGTALRAEGNIVPADDDDWYQFLAVDTPETDCDEFFVDVRFESNPGDQFAFTVYVGDCATNICAGDVLFQYFTDCTGTRDGNVIGECPCTATNTPGHTICEDSSNVFYVRVRRVGSDISTCEGYSLIVTNGSYATPAPRTCPP